MAATDPPMRPRSTRQRAAVARALAGTGGFRTAQELHDELRAVGERIGLTTVYRTLQTMSDAGDVDVMRREDGETMYRRCSTGDHHHHLVCRSCGYSVEIGNDEVERWTARAARQHGFHEVTHDVQIFGLCGACR